MTLLTKDTLKNKYQQRPYLVFMRVFFFFFFFFFFLIFFIKNIYCGYSFELHRQVDAIQMGTHNICLYKEVVKKYTGYNLKTMELLDYALIGVYAVIRSNTVCHNDDEGTWFHQLLVFFFQNRSDLSSSCDSEYSLCAQNLL